MEEKKMLKIAEEYLDDLVKLHSTKLAGKSMKRFELFTDEDDNTIANANILKNEIKELIYESYRDFKDILIAHNYGLNMTIYKTKE